MARNRVIYQSEALFVSPNATGSHFTCSAVYSGTGYSSTAGAGRTGPQLHTLTKPIGLYQDPALTLAFDGEPVNSTFGEWDLKNISGQLGTMTGYHTVNATSQSSSNGGSAVYTNVSAWESFLAQNKTQGIAGKDHHTTGYLVQPFSGSYENLVQQIHRVQSANYSFTINRTDVNCFGKLARIDAIVLEPPTVSLDFSYYPTDGFNERNLGFHIKGADDVGPMMTSSYLNSVSGLLQDNSAGRNFFILTTPEGTDAVNTTRAVADRSVISLGNGFLSDYSLEGSVGSIPTASCSVELFNAKSDIGTTGQSVPSVTLTDGTAITDTNFTIGHPELGVDKAPFRGDKKGSEPTTGDINVTALRPGDITLDIPENLSIFNKTAGDGGIHIQNFNLSVPLSRTPIDRLGTRFAFSRSVDFPVVSQLTVNALVSEVGEGNLASIIDSCEIYDIKLKMKANDSCGAGSAADSIVVDFLGARLDSESMSSDIGSNKSVDLTFTTQIGGPEDIEHGVVISGANRTVVPEWYPAPGK